MALRLEVPQVAIEEFCKRNRIRWLALFGSALRDDFGPESDVDVLVEFEQGFAPGFIGLAGLEIELSELFGRKVDLLTPGFFRPAIRKQIMNEALVQYEESG